jgi:TRAP-type uncharacterized transport system substrate-binding protein
MHLLAVTCSALAVFALFGATASAQKARNAPVERYPAEIKMLATTNAWTIGLAAGQLEEAPLRFATELARVLDDGDNMRVMPIVTRGPFENIYDLLYLRGVDAAIVHSDVLEHFRHDPRIASIDRRITYIITLAPSEVHVFARPEIKTLGDLAGKPVNFNTRGTAASYSGPIIFDRLGIPVQPRFDPHPVAMAEMIDNDKYAATVWVSSKPLDAFAKQKWPDGFKLLAVPLTEKLEDYYLPAELEASDYPDLIAAGQKVETVAVPAVLAAYGWPQLNDRYKRMARFVDYLVERFPRLQQEAGFHPKWKEVNLAATVPGWQRFRPMQDKLSAIAAKSAGSGSAAASSETIGRFAPGDKAEQDRQLRESSESRKARPKQ